MVLLYYVLTVTSGMYGFTFARAVENVCIFTVYIIIMVFYHLHWQNSKMLNEVIAILVNAFSKYFEVRK